MLGIGSLADFAVASYSRSGTTDVLTLESGTLTLTGHDVSLSIRANLEAGALLLDGGDFPNYRVIVEHGTLTLTPSDLAMRTTLPLAGGALILTGKPVSFSLDHNIECGSLLLAGKEIAASTTLPLDSGGLTLTGKALSFTTTLPLQAGTLLLDGKDVPVYRLIVDTGRLLLDGQNIPTVTTLPVEPGHLVLFARDLRLVPLGGGGSDRKRPAPSGRRKPLKRIERMIEVMGEDGRPKKMPLLARFAPPPPPPDLVVLPDGFAKPLPPELLAPLELPRPAVSDLALETRDALDLRDVTDAMAAIAMIPDPIADAAELLIRDALDAAVAISMVPDPMSDHIRELIRALEQEQTQAAPEAAFSLEGS